MAFGWFTKMSPEQRQSPRDALTGDGGRDQQNVTGDELTWFDNEVL